MYYPNRRQEKKLQRKGFKYIAGIDEAGRGAWAGPIVAAAVILNPKVKIKGIKDSKLLRSPDRKELFLKITENAVAWGIGVISHKMIDQIGIQQANILAMKDAVKNLAVLPDYLLTDALTIEYKKLPNLAIIDGDYKITTIAAASIIAKVSRDQIMDGLDEKYPPYGFKQHKGYGTSHHFQMINQYGICELHRKSFEPIKYFIN
ncbi:MAG: ribonuclease HII [Patescibacteria group bacterium]|jgi:ribonuclease HII